jgi:lipopolysaccharide biosynthesis glycosyltransferase
MEPKREGLLHIAMAFDQHYLHPFYALLTSILEHHENASLCLHVIVTGVDEVEKNAIRQYVEKSGNQISYYAIDDTLVKRFVLANTWTQAVYYRLFFPLLIPSDVKRLLYIDTDTIVVNSLAPLYHQPLMGHPLGAVADIYVKTQALIGIHTEGEYFNSGMLLMDTERWRAERISEKACDYLTRFPERILFVDQCALNAVLHQNWQPLPSKFNLLYSYLPEDLAASQIHDYLRDKVLIHFTLHRPWDMLSRNRLGFLYFYYLKRSPVGRSARRFNDFSMEKLPAYLKIKLLNFYFDAPFVGAIWRRLKRTFRTNNV